MYANPTLIRDVVVQVRLNAAEAELLTAITNFTGGQRSSVMRELAMRQARSVLSGHADIALEAERDEASQSAAIGMLS